jgi:indole-3-glycerol phosphate synthase
VEEIKERQALLYCDNGLFRWSTLQKNPHLQPTMPTQLDQILAHTLLEVTGRKATADLVEMERKAVAHTPRGFAARLREVSATGPAVISEIKKASPSKGLIRADFYPAALAQASAAG